MPYVHCKVGNLIHEVAFRGDVASFSFAGVMPLPTCSTDFTSIPCPILGLAHGGLGELCSGTPHLVALPS